MSYTLLPKLISDHLSLNDVNQLAYSLNLDPENVFGPNDTKPARARTLFQKAGRSGLVAKLLNALHAINASLPLKPYLHLLMVENYAFSPDEIKNMYAERFADEHGRFLITDPTAQAQQIQEYFEKEGRAEDFYNMVAGRAPVVEQLPFLNPSYQPPTPDIEVELPPSPKDVPADKPEESYVDFDININPADVEGVYQITARSAGSQTQTAVRQSLPDDPLFTDTLNMLKTLLVDGSGVAKLGEMLHDFLFPPEVHRLFTRVTAQNKKVRIRINIFAESVNLHQIPWEYCRFDDEFLATDLDTPIVRYIPIFQEGATMQGPTPMRVLVALSSPEDQKPINIDKEAANIRKALAPLEKSGKVELHLFEHITQDDLIDHFMDIEPHIFHFVGHGGTKENGEGFIIVEDDMGESAEMDAEDMKTLINTAGEATKLVILAACESGVAGSGAEVVTNGGFMGMGARLLKEVPAVIAMQVSVPQSTTFDFTKNVYRYLSKGEPLDMAVTRSRVRLFLRGKDKVYWGIPVLFMRSPDGKIW